MQLMPTGSMDASEEPKIPPDSAPAKATSKNAREAGAVCSSGLHPPPVVVRFLVFRPLLR